MTPPKKPSARIHDPTHPARCANAAERRALIEALLAAWDEDCDRVGRAHGPAAHKRLGQFLMVRIASAASVTTFQVEDGELWELLENPARSSDG